MMRIALFLLTNIAVLAVASIVLSLLGVNSILAQNGVDLDLQALLIFSAVFGFAGSLISLFMSKWMAKRAARVQVIDQPRTQTEQWLVTTVRELSTKAGIGMPEVGIFPAQQSNAFATGWNRNASLVAVSEGMLQRFSRDEIRAVLAHEIGHVANGDMVTLTLVQGVVNTFVIFFSRVIGHVVDRVVFKTERGYGPGYYIVSIVAQILLGFLATAIVMWFSRFREYRADAAGAQLANRQGMISALEHLKAESGVPDQMPESLTAFGINMGLRQGLKSLFHSHPPLDDRIAALREQRHG
ncbi:heat shock protein HtpX [Alcanivorax sp. S71-1-4]|jgi:heat shock protein HtpX|uniref:protease HtpX n=1 Tax=Alcanivorax sp. S71-1-4 TaxID=1177159 RepID=UPI001356F06B|nr:protease HtpX [Alcanivorax sp. S71-1-4]KAF0807491.1 heat shock protein HtpX [Alcanivorax sp. S71-1-4]